MARVYTSRQLIDPNLANYMEQVIQNRVTNQLNRDKMLGDSVRHMLTGIGSAADEAYTNWKNKNEEQARYDQIMGQSTIAQQSDPNYIAAVKDYAKTGNSQPITSYMLGKEAAEAKKEAAKQSKATQDWHDRNQKMAAEDNYETYRKEALVAQDNGDYATAEYLLNKANRLKNEWAERGYDIGEDFGSILDAAKKAKEEAAAKKEIEERDERMMRESEALEKKEAEEKAANSYSNRIFIETEVIPELKNVAQKAEAKAQIERLYNDGQLSMDDRKALHAKIDGTETVGEGKQKVHKQKAEEATGKAIDEANNKAEAKKYVGKKMNSLEWNKIPAEQKKYLNRDAQGVVTEK